ncbi:2TM domain-containing protein [Winogradskyella maritima]|uniref:2TM domain-containing protein n=1 Tax=Winogradskyella maritima TaxID=1517766 RepID=A0ABV8AGW9_9FLAO|nr:2TM domain-containing protein [Winogradskyella maritima]
MENKNDIFKRERAKNKVEKLKRFYSHLTVYLIINVLIMAMRLRNDLDSWDSFVSELSSFGTWSTWLVWGIILAIHAFSVFLFPLILGYDWEERKIEELMEEDLKYKRK